jgi:NAD-dependent SIR2 family protein deacetylase
MGFMEMQITQRGALYTCECDKCGATLYTHEWAHFDHNERRDAMENGTLRCDECHGKALPETFSKMKGQYYAGRYSAPGYLDCTDWDYGRNLRNLKRHLKSMYGE